MTMQALAPSFDSSPRADVAPSEAAPSRLQRLCNALIEMRMQQARRYIEIYHGDRLPPWCEASQRQDRSSGANR